MEILQRDPSCRFRMEILHGSPVLGCKYDSKSITRNGTANTTNTTMQRQTEYQLDSNKTRIAKPRYARNSSTDIAWRNPRRAKRASVYLGPTLQPNMCTRVVRSLLGKLVRRNRVRSQTLFDFTTQTHVRATASPPPRMRERSEPAPPLYASDSEPATVRATASPPLLGRATASPLPRVRVE